MDLYAIALAAPMDEKSKTFPTRAKDTFQKTCYSPNGVFLISKRSLSEREAQVVAAAHKYSDFLDLPIAATTIGGDTCSTP
jgi:hypothetical protein